MFALMSNHIKDLYVTKPHIFGDHSGFFLKPYQKQTFDNLALNYDIVQYKNDIFKISVLRGLHYQINHPQTECMSVLCGEIFDLAVCLRKDIQTCDKWNCIKVNCNNKLMLMISRGFAHGFFILNDKAQFKCRWLEYYQPNLRSDIIYNNLIFNIEFLM